MHGNLVPLVISLLIWGVLFLYLWRLEGRVRQVQRELDDLLEGREADERGEEVP